MRIWYALQEDRGQWLPAINRLVHHRKPPWLRFTSLALIQHLLGKTSPEPPNTRKEHSTGKSHSVTNIQRTLSWNLIPTTRAAEGQL